MRADTIRQIKVGAVASCVIANPDKDDEWLRLACGEALGAADILEGLLMDRHLSRVTWCSVDGGARE